MLPGRLRADCQVDVRVHGFLNLDFRFRTLDLGFWNLDVGFFCCLLNLDPVPGSELSVSRATLSTIDISIFLYVTEVVLEGYLWT